MNAKPLKEVIVAFGHENIQAAHPTTLMITKDAHLSKNGDCVIAVAADKAAADLNPEFKKTLRQPNAKVTIQLEVDGLVEKVAAVGSPQLQLTHPTDLVVRKSNFVCNRTLAIQADKSSNDLSRSLVEKLSDPKQTIKITLTVNL